MFGSCSVLIGAVPYSSSNANDATYANYTTGYLTYLAEGEKILRVYGTVYAVNDTEYHLVYNTTGNLASGYTEDQRVFTSGNLRGGATYTTWDSYSANITKAIIEEEIKPRSCSYYFDSMTVLTEIENIENINTSDTTSLHSMFYKCSSLTSLDVSGFSTENVTDMAYMFYYCSVLTSLDVNSFDTSNVTDMSQMFYGCDALLEIDFSGFDTSNVIDMNYMFAAMDEIEYLDLSSFDTSRVTNMNGMFWLSGSLVRIYVGDGWSTDAVSTSSSMFYNNTALRGAVYYKTSNENDVTYANYTTGYLTYIGDITNDSSVYGSVYAVSDAEYHLVLNTTGNLASGYSIDQLIFTSENLRLGAPNSPWGSYAELIKTAIIEEEIKPISCSYYFKGLTALTEIKNINNINTSNVFDMTHMFYNCKGLTSLDLSDFYTNRVTSMAGMFYYCKGLTSLDLSSFDTSRVASMSEMFNYCQSLTSLDVSGFNTSKVTNMVSMFSSCYKLKSLDVSSFDTSAVTNMNGMFSYNWYITSLDLSSFDTSNVTNMNYMFANLDLLEKIYVGDSWSTDTVTTSTKMFNNCTALSGAVAYSADNANDVTFANYTTGYLTYKGE